MKLLNSIALLGMIALPKMASAASTNIVDCTVSKMHNYEYFEESLSEDEYPNVYVERETQGLSVHFGMSLYENTPGSDDVSPIKLSKTAAQNTVEVGVFDTEHKPYSTVTLVIERRNSGKMPGKIWVKEHAKSKKVLIADVTCEKVSF